MQLDTEAARAASDDDRVCFVLQLLSTGLVVMCLARRRNRYSFLVSTVGVTLFAVQRLSIIRCWSQQNRRLRPEELEKGEGPKPRDVTA